MISFDLPDAAQIEVSARCPRLNVSMVLDQDPIANLRNSTSIKYVIKNGRVCDANTLDEVAPRVKPLPKQDWLNVVPAGVRAGIR